ncbi:Protein RTA1 [Paramyrothecium foliicola]|nr:Protein RTA1 [Paramyrothecium foliicola]
MDEFKLYLYNPSVAAAVIFALLFSGVSIWHCRILHLQKIWSFIPFTIGCIVEMMGYAARAHSATQSPNWSLMPYILQSVLILLGPAFFAASIYMVLGRLIRFLEAEHLSMIRVGWLTKLFLLGDILSFFGQGGGGGLLASAKDKRTQDLGNTVIIIGLAVQVIFFGGFMVVTAIFHKRIAQRPTNKSQNTDAPWEMFLVVLYISSVLIMVRSVFRMVEYAQGHNGALISKEIYVYTLDGLLMFAVAVIFAVRHPCAIFAHKKLSDPLSHYHMPSDYVPMFAQDSYGRPS